MNYITLLYVHKRLLHLSRILSFNMYNMPSSFIVQSILIRFTIKLVMIPLVSYRYEISLIKHFVLQEYTFISINKHWIHIATLQWILYRHTWENLLYLQGSANGIFIYLPLISCPAKHCRLLWQETRWQCCKILKFRKFCVQIKISIMLYITHTIF